MRHRRKWVFISVTMGVIVNAVILYNYYDDATFQSLTNVDNSLILALLFTVLASILLESMKLKTLASQIGVNLRLKESAKLHLVTVFGGYSTPMSAGDTPLFMLWGLCKKVEMNKWVALSIVKNFLTKLTFMLFLIISLLLTYITDTNAVGQAIYKVAAISIIPSTFFSLLVIYKFGLVERFIRLLPKRIKRNWAKGSHIQVKQLMSSKIIVPYIFTVLYWLVFFCPPLLIAIKMNIEICLVQLYINQFLIYTTLPFSPLPGGSGVVELIYFSLFIDYIPTGQLVVFILLCRLISYYIPLCIGACVATKELK
ncbi:lysylphosphatidylglycerol synthase transmembrane domain-containing protein [Proteinivorax hydrogeniformans]|uniref:Phosphatidylglycerol lysyltransferase n=1 Tax=Proteinivorax hydrogeniformans TaxID=1826727 RepID=A0AAU8HSY5_9FIRM